jgi:multicomponent Na+:H+ antiporter subunit D
LRGLIGAAASIAAAGLIFTPSFGEHAAFAQIGLVLTPLRLDPLSQVIGLALSVAAGLFSLRALAQDRRLQDGAVLTLFGGALSAVFAGDMVSFAAAATMSGMAAAALTATGGRAAQPAAGRVLIWQALAAGAMVAAAGLRWADLGHVGLDPLDAETPAGLAFLLALLVLAGAPLAHVWMKDAVTRASAGAAGAIAAAMPALAIYGLVRAFPGEASLPVIGAVLIGVGLIMAAAATDPRRIMAYGVVSHVGMMMGAVGLGSQLALAAAAAMAFTHVLVASLAHLALFGPEGRAVRPAFVGLIAASGLGVPGFAGYAGASMLLEAAGGGGLPWFWAAAVVGMAGAGLHLGLRAPLLAMAADAEVPAPKNAGWPPELVLGGVLLLAIGAAPGWLMALLPPEPITFDLFALSPMALQLQIVGAGLLAGALALALQPTPRALALRDVDWIYSGPLRAAALWTGAVLARLSGAIAAAGQRLGYAAGQGLIRAARWGDRPSAPHRIESWPLLCLGVLLCAFLTLSTL